MGTNDTNADKALEANKRKGHLRDQDLHGPKHGQYAGEVTPHWKQGLFGKRNADCHAL